MTSEQREAAIKAIRRGSTMGHYGAAGVLNALTEEFVVIPKDDVTEETRQYPALTVCCQAIVRHGDIRVHGSTGPICATCGRYQPSLMPATKGHRLVTRWKSIKEEEKNDA